MPPSFQYFKWAWQLLSPILLMRIGYHKDTNRTSPFTYCPRLYESGVHINRRGLAETADPLLLAERLEMAEKADPGLTFMLAIMVPPR